MSTTPTHPTWAYPYEDCHQIKEQWFTWVKRVFFIETQITWIVLFVGKPPAELSTVYVAYVDRYKSALILVANIHHSFSPTEKAFGNASAVE